MRHSTLSVAFLAGAVQSWTPVVVHRRQVLKTVFGGTAAVLLRPREARAADSVPKEAELEKLRLGYARVQYLLNNWDEITTVCSKGGSSDGIAWAEGDGKPGCEPNPTRV